MNISISQLIVLIIVSIFLFGDTSKIRQNLIFYIKKVKNFILK